LKMHLRRRARSKLQNAKQMCYILRLYTAQHNTSNTSAYLDLLGLVSGGEVHVGALGGSDLGLDSTQTEVLQEVCARGRNGFGEKGLK